MSFRKGTIGHTRRMVRVLALLTLIGVLSACGNAQDASTSNDKAGSGGPTIPVTTATAVQKTVPVRLDAVGIVEAYATVNVKSRVDGQIVQVHFREGDYVAEGAPLFDIDPRPFQVQLQQAEAELAREQAQLALARAAMQRYEDLSRRKLASKEQYDQARTALEAAEAQVRAAKATVENAKLQLDYATIRAPIAGRVGAVLLHAGNMVKANDTAPLVVLRQLSPIYVSFSVPERELPILQRRAAAGSLQVQVTVPETDLPALTGQLSFIDNTVDAATGTVRLKATFKNEERLLWPGQFVRVALAVSEHKDAVVVPAQAVQTGPEGAYVFVVAPDETAQMRAVQVAYSAGGESVIGQGLAPGERVVTLGQSRLASGIKVKFDSAASTP
ncbi:MAG: efflux RND transporter periplasmic adaptor subunit [Gammaproteobacteria bacterium]